MKIWLMIISAMLIATFTCRAQSTTTANTLPIQFAPSAEEFSVNAPCNFVEDENKQEWSIYQCSANGASYFITSNPDEASSQLDAIKSLAVKSTLTESSYESASLKGSRISFTDTEGFYQELVYTTKSRFYIFHAISEANNNPDISSFLNSVRLDHTAFKTRRKSTNPRTISDILTMRSLTSDRMVSSKSSYLFKKPVSNSLSTIEPGQNSSLKILEKPRPSYTGLAVLYSIGGIVQLRVTFLASGTVGVVTPLKKVPFGLTENAVSAAHFLGFEPKIVDGTPVDVVKLVEYSFSIY